MNAPWVVIAAIVGIGACYVLLPVVGDTFRRFRTKKSLRCPVTGGDAEVGVDAGRAALTSAFGRALLRVKNCSLWPERKGCAQDCLSQPEAEGQETKRPHVH